MNEGTVYGRWFSLFAKRFYLAFHLNNGKADDRLASVSAATLDQTRKGV